MMTFEEYHEYLENWQEKDTKLRRRIAYREIQLIGKTDDRLESLFVNPISSGLSEDDKQLLDKDEILRSLKYEKEVNDKEMKYVLKHAAFPLTHAESVSQMNKVEENC